LNPRESLQPVIYLDRCNGCGRCVDVCPAHALEVVQGKVQLLHTDCDYCGECEAACPTGAIGCPYDIVWEAGSAPAANP